MNFKASVALAALAIGMFAAQGSQAANLIIDGDFETTAASANGPVPGSPWLIVAQPGQFVDGGVLDLTGADYIPCCGTTGTAAELANHFATFGAGNVAGGDVLLQDVFTKPGQTYLLTYDSGALGGGSQSFSAVIINEANNQTLVSQTTSPTANDALGATFSSNSLRFVATGGQTLIAFTAPGAGINVDPVLDNVSVTAVPEPATWAMMLVGFGGLGMAMRSRRKRAPTAA
jgi:hypothetical protein